MYAPLLTHSPTLYNTLSYHSSPPYTLLPSFIGDQRRRTTTTLMYSEHGLPSLGPLTMDPRWKTNVEIAPNCPRCASTNTKFCYYNNYSLSQPRYFCKACRRYWTKGGSLRNVPFGGGCRKNRRGKSVRAPHSGQASTSHSDSDHTGYGSDLANSGMTARNGSDIDLADVFSKFLKQADSSLDPGLSEPEPGFQNVIDDQSLVDLLSNSTSLNYDQMSQELCMDPLPDLQHAQLDEMFQPEFVPSDNHHQDRIPQLVDSDPNAYGLQALLGDELWSENNPVLPNSSCQQQPQLQGWEQFQDDHSLFHSNILHGNWNSFDIPNYGI